MALAVSESSVEYQPFNAEILICGLSPRPSETMPREELEALQLRRLKSMLEKVYYNVPFYQNKFNGAGVRPENIRSLDDIRRLPFTEKQDLRDNYPYGLFAVPRDNVVRVHASSGTTGKATVVGYTQRDVNNWAEPQRADSGTQRRARSDRPPVAKM